MPPATDAAGGFPFRVPMKHHQLQVFLTVVEQGSLHGAARALGQSQPAVTFTVRELEKMLGVPLLVRSVAGVRLTEYGEAFRVRARQIVEDMRRAREDLLAMRDGAGGQVSATVSSAVARAFIPEAFAAFRREDGKTSVSFREASLSSALNALRDGQTDFAVVNNVPGMRWPDFAEHRALLPMRLLVAARRGHPLARSRSLARLREAEWLLASEPGDDFDHSFAQFFAAQGLEAPERILRCQSLAPTVALLKTTDVLALVTEPTFALELRQQPVSVVRLREALPEIVASIVVRRDRPLTLAAARLLSCMEAVAHSFRATYRPG